MSVLLVFPRMGQRTGDPPLGIAYVAAYLRSRGVPVKIFDTTFRDSWGYVKRRISDEHPDILGIYSTTTMLRDAFKVADVAKEAGIPLVVLGGPHPSVSPEETLGHRSVDAVVVGEGEHSFFRVVKGFHRRSIRGLVGIPNVYVKIGKKIHRARERYFIENLDDIPFPARDLLDMESYIRNWFQLDAVSRGLRGTSVFSMRYCPYNCTFCQPAVKEMFGKRMRRRSPQNIIEELKYLKDKYKIDAFQIYDDTFLLDWEYVDDFCTRMIDEGLGLLWSCHTRADLLPGSGLIKKMRSAGLRMVGIGIESGVQRILDMYNKGITPEQTSHAIDTFKSHGIRVRGYFILGAPTETLAEIKQTTSFAVDSLLDEAVFSILCPFPGTYLYDTAKASGWCIREEWGPEHYYSKSPFVSCIIPGRLIRRYQRIAFMRFYFHRRRLRYIANSVIGARRGTNKIRTYFI